MKTIKMAIAVSLVAAAWSGIYWCLLGYRDSDQSIMAYLKFGAISQLFFACHVMAIYSTVGAEESEIPQHNAIALAPPTLDSDLPKDVPGG